jgi:glycosyltransferase involved in cell wall biosynthesis
MRKYTLSILIPSIPERNKQLATLLTEVYRQYDELVPHIPYLGDVEILIDDTKRYLDGGLSIGKKRESLIERAEGKYLCFLDDDESIAPNYLETLVRLCCERKDVVTFRNISKLDNYWMIVDMSLIYKENQQASPTEMITRRPWHICPVLSKYAKLYAFEDISYGEDWNWMEKVLTHCQTEAKTNAVLHGYNHSKTTSEADRITAATSNGKSE